MDQLATKIVKFSNVFTEKELVELKAVLQETTEDTLIYQYSGGNLGRLHIENAPIPEFYTNRIESLIHSDFPGLLPTSPTPLYVEYSAEYGSPNLPPHFDGDTNSLIFDYQLESNVVWPLGTDLTLHPLQDNEGVAFNPNETIHWRPKKTFKPGEYVRMIFFRFHKPDPDRADYSYLPNHQDDPVFAEVKAYRESLGEDSFPSDGI